MKLGQASEIVQIAKYPFNKDLISAIEDNIWVQNLWPLVYIISDDVLKEAYVGESTQAMKRMLNHLSNAERKKLGNLHLITSNVFNKSAALDIEANLIKYISGDGKYKLQNGNAGLATHNYYQKDEYFKMFSFIWGELKKERLTIKGLEEIDNSDLFKYSPYKTLSSDQYTSIREIINVLLTKSYESIIIDGSAGTGKTILAIFLMKLLVSDVDSLFNLEDTIEDVEEQNLVSDLKRAFPHPKIAVVVPMTSLRNTLKKVFKNIKGLSAKMVIGPSDVAREKYDILIVDEAHRLRRRVNITNYKSFDDSNKILGFDNTGTELDWILKQSTNQIFFYDAAQSVKPSDIPKEKFDSLMEQSFQIKLQSQMRVKGGNDYISFVDKLLNVQMDSKTSLFVSEEYDFRLFDSLAEMLALIRQKEKEVGLSRLVAGYSWEWKSRNANVPDIEIENLKLKWNSESSEWINSKNAIDEVGCIHTTQGYDLNYTGVIFGNEISYDPVKAEISIRAKNYHDRNGKSGIKDPQQLKSYIVNIYKTLMFRGIRGTFVYACDENLREYLRKYIFSDSKRITKGNEIVQKRKEEHFINCVPLYNLAAAAGGFSELQDVKDFEWIKTPDSIKISKDYFACRVIGESMNKKIPNGSICLFRKDSGGTREGKIVLVEHAKIEDFDFGAGYTVKLYHSEKLTTEEGWSHSRIILKPMSTESRYSDIVLEEDDVVNLKIVGIFEGVIG